MNNKKTPSQQGLFLFTEKCVEKFLAFTKKEF